jgi:hypothetical protein
MEERRKESKEIETILTQKHYICFIIHPSIYRTHHEFKDSRNHENI